jgi:LPS-assembly protein
VGLPGDFGGRWRATASMANLFREEGTDSRRISVGTEWQAPYIGALGEVYTFTASLRGDAYYSNDVIDFRNGQPRDGGFDGRLFPQLAAEVHWPWVREGQHWSQLIEPIAAVIVAPTGLNHPDIPNEDSIAFDFDETDLFVRNRLPGYDRVDEGQRVDYGLRAAIYGDSGGSSSLLIGQSYRLQRDTTAFPTGSGLDDHFSDIVGRVVVSPNSLLDLAYRFRLDKDQITTVRRQEVSATGGPESLRLGISYLDIPGQTGAAANPALQQVSASVTAALTRYWTVGLATTRNLNGGTEDISSSLTATYRDECLAFIASITQSGTSDRDLRPGTSVLFTLVLKNLGEIGGRVFEESGSSQ